MIHLIWVIQCIFALPFMLAGFLYETARGAFKSGRSFALFTVEWVWK